MKRIIAVTAVAVSVAAGSFAGGTWWAHRSGAAGASAQASHAPAVYTCPMHPDYRSRPSWQLPDLRHAPRGGGDGRTQRRATPRRARSRRARCR